MFIKNQIRVKPYFNYHTADKKANIFINNLPDNADPLELEQEFSQYGNVLSLDIHRDSNGKSLKYKFYSTKAMDMFNLRRGKKLKNS